MFSRSKALKNKINYGIAIVITKICVGFLASIKYFALWISRLRFLGNLTPNGESSSSSRCVANLKWSQVFEEDNFMKANDSLDVYIKCIAFDLEKKINQSKSIYY